MTQSIIKSVVLPVDGSKNALKALDYLSSLFKSDHNLHITLLYVQPSLPPIMVEESLKHPETAKQIKTLQKKNEAMGETILEEAKNALKQKGIREDRIARICHKKQSGVARDICAFSESKTMDAIVLASKGRSRLEAFFMGETASKVLEASKICPVWLVKGTVSKTSVLIALDHSENALKAVDHAGYMLSGTDTKITLFHAKRKLRRFIPQSLINSAPNLESLWQKTVETDMTPIFEQAKHILIKAGINENAIEIRMEEGSRDAATDIISAAKKMNCGSIVVGREGATAASAYVLGNVARKLMEKTDDMALWVI